MGTYVLREVGRTGQSGRGRSRTNHAQKREESSVSLEAARKKCAAVVLASVFAAACLCGCAQQWSESQTFVMNTVLQQTVDGPEEICAQNARIAQNLENLLSRTLETSEIYAANHADGPVEVSQDTAAVVSTALAAWQDTNGAFDPALGAFRDAWGFGSDNPHVPDEATLQELLNGPRAGGIVLTGETLDASGADIDLGGAAKGYALDMMRRNMEDEDVSNALLSFGGAILAMGKRPDGQDWRIGIRDPFSDDATQYIGTFSAADVCIETSGVSEQQFTEDGRTYHHILDPETGMPARGTLMSVCVAGDSGIMTDIWSTALFVMGLEDGAAYAQAHDIPALFITSDKEIWLTSWFRYEIEDLDPSYLVV